MDEETKVITPVSEAHEKESTFFGGLEAYLIEFCQFDPKQLSYIYFSLGLPGQGRNWL